MKNKSHSIFSLLFIISLISLSPSFSTGDSGFCTDEMATLGGVHDSHATANSVETDGLARFAVEEHNKKENAMLEFARVVKAKEQVASKRSISLQSENFNWLER